MIRSGKLRVNLSAGVYQEYHINFEDFSIDYELGLLSVEPPDSPYSYHGLNKVKSFHFYFD